MIRHLVLSRWTAIAAAIAAASAAHLLPWGLLSLTPTISLVEAEWSLAALVGVVYSADFIRECLGDGRVATMGDEATRLYVEMLILVGGLLLGLHLILLSFGLLAMRVPTSLAATSPGVRLLGVVLTVSGEMLILTLVVIRAKRARIRELAALSLKKTAGSAPDA